MTEEKIDELIKKHLEFQGKTDDKWYLQSSVRNYLETGKVSGSFYESIIDIIKNYKISWE